MAPLRPAWTTVTVRVETDFPEVEVKSMVPFLASAEVFSRTLIFTRVVSASVFTEATFSQSESLLKVKSLPLARALMSKDAAELLKE